MRHCNVCDTVAGITFYEHGETPGLGAECEKAWFQTNFIGKKISDKDGEFVSIGIAKSAVPADTPSEQKRRMVDGISGATLTTDGVDDMMEATYNSYKNLLLN